ncbi:AEC family transporter [Bdellovibrionota bacterium FG-2]
MLQTLFGFFMIMMSGVIWNLIPALPKGTKVRGLINPLVLNFLLPLLVYRAFVQTSLRLEMWKIPSGAAIGCLATLFITLELLKLFEKRLRRPLSNSAKGALLLVASWGNVTYLGIPLLTSWVGEKIQMLAVIYDLAAFSPLLFSMGAWIGGRFGNEQECSKTFDFSILKLPPLWAAIAGIITQESGLAEALPSPILLLCQGASKMVGPLMIFSVGLALRIPKISRVAMMAPSVLVKLVVSPLVVYGVSRIFGLSGDLLRAETLEAAMPTMVLTLVISERFKLDSELLTQIIAVSTLFSFMDLRVFEWVLFKVFREAGAYT